jgi:single-strand DNA-binding protein
VGLPAVNGEFGVVADPEIRFSDSGKCWMKVRGVAKKRVRDSNGAWADGDPTFIDIVCFGQQAEHLGDSVLKGDTILVVGELEQQTWDDKETGEKRSNYRIIASEIGVSVRWGAAKSQRVLEETGVATAAAGLGGSVDSDEPPF